MPRRRNVPISDVTKARMAASRVKFGHTVKVSIDGTEYESKAAACRELSLTRFALDKRLASTEFPNYIVL